ncbi:MAG: hypothetical protein AB1757_17615 [Acidobacteriota bacterium]
MADVDNQIRLFTEIFKTLWEHKAIDWQSAKVDGQLIAAYTPFSDLAEMVTLLPSANRPRITGEFGAKHLWLRSDSGAQPVVHLKFDFSRNLPDVKIRLGLFKKQGDKKGKAFGFRYESPEGSNSQGSGTHHYYHVQLIRGFKRDSDFVYKCPKWLPLTDPALPLPATDSVSLLLCFIASLYGIAEVQSLFRQVEGVKDYFEAHPFRPFDALSWYRLMTSRRDGQKHHYEVADPDIAEPKLRHLHQNHDLTEITHSEYSRLTRAKKLKL